VGNSRRGAANAGYSGQEESKGCCNPILLAIVSLLGLAGIVLGVLFGLGIIGGSGVFGNLRGNGNENNGSINGGVAVVPNGSTVIVNNGTWGPGDSAGLDLTNKVLSDVVYSNPSSVLVNTTGNP
jgi:hypothetical protein